MFLLVLFVSSCLIRASVVFAGYEAQSITCVCSTTHCLEHKMSRCNTTGVCFSQYLDRRDGSHPLVRGCIPSKTQLLCENRKPAIVGGSWPLLLCCDSNLCNMDVVPTPPPWFQREIGDQSDQNKTEVVQQNEVETIQRPSSSHNDTLNNDSHITDLLYPSTNVLSGNDAKRSSSTFPTIVSPVYITVLVLGIVSLVFIGIVAAVVLRRNNKFYAEQYGALDRQPEYFKHHQRESVKLAQDDKEWEVDETVPCRQPHLVCEATTTRT